MEFNRLELNELHATAMWNSQTCFNTQGVSFDWGLKIQIDDGQLALSTATIQQT